MNKMELPEIHLIGLSLPTKTKNEKGQSAFDCGNLWQKFEQENYAHKIPNKLSEDILAVYHQYDGDHTHPYSYFISNCRIIPHGVACRNYAAENECQARQFHEADPER